MTINAKDAELNNKIHDLTQELDEVMQKNIELNKENKHMEVISKMLLKYIELLEEKINKLERPF